MKTENQNNNFQELDRRVEQMLTPRFAPSVEEVQLPTSTRHNAHSVWLNALRIGSVAAAIVIGLFIIVSPTNKVEAKEPIELISEALQEFHEADSYRITFTAKVKPAPKNDNDYYRMASDGNKIKGQLILLKTDSNNGGIMRIEWASGVTQLYDGERYYEWEGTTQTDDKHCPFQTLKLFKLADLDFVLAEFRKDGLKINDERDGDKLQVIKDSPDYAIVGERLEGIFSKKSGKLVGGGYYEKKGNEWIPLIKLNKVEYGFPLTLEEITSRPKK